MLNYHKTEFFKMLKIDILACVIFFVFLHFVKLQQTTTKLNNFVQNCYYPLKTQEFVQKLFELIALTFVYLLSSPSLDGGAHRQTVCPRQRCQGGL